MSRCPHCYSEINFGATKCPRCTGNIVYDDKPLTHWKAFALIGAIGAPILDSYADLGIGILWSVVIGAIGAPLLLFMLTRSSGNKG